jgi:hypothetical protein
MATVHPMRPWRVAVIIVGLWALFGLWSTQQYLLLTIASGREVESWTRPFAVYLGSAMLWAAFTPLIMLAVRRLPRAGRGLLVAAGGHLALFIAIASVDTMVDRAWYAWLTQSAQRPFWPAAISQGNTNLFSYLVVALTTFAVDYYGAFRERTLAASQLAGQLARSQLQALRAQLHPHFLFNTLNGIAALMHRDVEAADRMLTRLSELLRTAMDAGETQEVTVREEMTFTEGYLEIERTRFSDRLTVTLDVHPEVETVAIPHLLLQPLVENAVRHGIAPRAGAGHITVRLRPEGAYLHVVVQDDGVGNGQEPSDGTGLGVTRQRLRHLYGPAATLRAGNHPGGGFMVTVTIPLRRLPDGSA